MESLKKWNSKIPSKIDALESAARSPKRHWTDSDERYLRKHRTDGASLIAHALGRSEGSVRHKASRLRVSLALKPGEACTVCGEHVIREGTVAARHKMCPYCWEVRKADQMRERQAERSAARDYEKQKKRAQRGDGE